MFDRFHVQQAAITVDQIMSTLPLTTDCQLNVVMDNGSQSLNAGDDYVQFLNPTAVDNTSEACLKIAQQSNEIVPALPSADCGEHYFDLDVELNQTIVNTNEVAGEELETVRVDSKFPVDIENEKDMSSNEPTERINPNDAYNNEPAEDERMSSDEEEEVVTPTNSYGRLQYSQSEDEHDSPAGMMSESETSDADEDLNETVSPKLFLPLKLSSHFKLSFLFVFCGTKLATLRRTAEHHVQNKGELCGHVEFTLRVSSFFLKQYFVYTLDK